MKTIALEFGTSMLGSLLPDVKKKIEKYLEKPTPANWDKIYSFIINGWGKPSTVWQAVLEIDPTFPRSAKMDESCKTRWSRIPSSELLKKALNNAIFKTRDN